MSKINLIKFYNFIYTPKKINKSGLCLPDSLSRDIVYIRKSKNLLQCPKEEIFRRIDYCIKPENFIGEGAEAKVYKIPDTDYVVKLNKHKDKDEIMDYKSALSFDINKNDKINHIVAKLGEGSSIMKYLRGKNCYIYKNKEELADLPTDIYYNLYKDICFAKDNNMLFDASGSNIIFNPERKTLTPIDFLEMDMSNQQEFLPLSDIFYAFGDASEMPVDSLKKIFLKIIEIAQKERASAKPVNGVSDNDINELLELARSLLFNL